MDSGIYQLILKRRTIRRFKQKKVPYNLLKKLINAARLAPSAANLQPLEYLVVDTPQLIQAIFPFLGWANYIAPRGSPPPDKRPTAYIAILVNKNKEIRKFAAYDIGAAVENIMLAAWEKGIGVCWIKALDKEKISALLNLPKQLRLDSLLALGYRQEMPKIEILKNSVKYWQDRQGVLHVPKRRLSQILHHNKIKK